MRVSRIDVSRVEDASERAAAPSQTGRRLTAWLLASIGIGIGVFLTVLWIRGGGITGIKSAGDALASAGRITGILGAYGALLQVVLISRLPWLETLAGFDRLTIWHRLNGKITIVLVMAHVVLITWGYTLLDKISLTEEAKTLLINYPSMVTATVGTGLMVLVVISSLVIVRKRLRYEAWYLVHLFAYLSILLSWFHQIPTGSDFITNLPAAAFWTGLYLGTLGIIITFRLLVPTVMMLHSRMRVSEVIEEAPGIVSLRITGRRLDRLHARAGQFFIWRFLARGYWFESHPFSLSEAPDGRSFRITVKGVGDFSRRLKDVKPGTLVLAEGPLGTFTNVVRRRERVLLVAGGIGITPIRALLEDLRCDVTVVYRALREADVVFRHELERLARERDAVLHIVKGDHTTPGAERLLSSDHLKAIVPDIAERELYVCGPPAMMNYVVAQAKAAGIPPKLIHSELFALSS